VTTSLFLSYLLVGRVTGVPPDDRTCAISG
jgi:hypothetical protein